MKLRDFIVTDAVVSNLKATDRDGVIRELRADDLLHGRYVMGSPLNRTAVVVASVVDLILITAIIVLWPGSHGLDNQFFVLYFPVVFGCLVMMIYFCCDVIATLSGNGKEELARDEAPQ